MTEPRKEIMVENARHGNGSMVADDDELGDYDPDWACRTCGGDRFEECEDTDTSEGCWEQDCNGRIHTCPNCRGSGQAKDQWYW